MTYSSPAVALLIFWALFCVFPKSECLSLSGGTREEDLGDDDGEGRVRRSVYIKNMYSRWVYREEKRLFFMKGSGTTTSDFNKYIAQIQTAGIESSTCLLLSKDPNTDTQDGNWDYQVKILGTIKGVGMGIARRPVDESAPPSVQVEMSSVCTTLACKLHYLNMTLSGAGFEYEDLRPTRNKYITPTDADPRFATLYNATLYEFEGPYDISSFFHRNKFGETLNKIPPSRDVKYRPVHPLLQHENLDHLGMGARLAKYPQMYLSFLDLRTIASYFKCATSCKLNCRYASYATVVKGSTTCRCICPPMFTGSRCDVIKKTGISPADCAKILTLRKTIQTIESPNFPASFVSNQNCFWFVKPATPVSSTGKKTSFYLDIFNSSCDEAQLTIFLYGPEVELHPLSCNQTMKMGFVRKWFESDRDSFAVAWKTVKNATSRSGFRLHFCENNTNEHGFCKPDTSKWTADQKIPCYSCDSDIDPTCARNSSIYPTEYEECDDDVNTCVLEVTKILGKTRVVKRCIGKKETCKNSQTDCEEDRQCYVCCKTPLCNYSGKVKDGEDPMDVVRKRLGIRRPLTPPGDSAGSVSENWVVITGLIIMSLVSFG